ncbi:preprotein translocase subunit SecG, partial [Escherichia coli]|uniref:preprotein translocase subunit SecG n=2 Tax=Gammaproteobacteria TaxID=1236 RepID=UPI0015CBA204
MYQLILMIHVLIAVILIGLVLIQHGKGADIGAAFGSGASNTLFGSQGTGGFLFKLTGGLAMTFFITSLMLSYMVST